MNGGVPTLAFVVAVTCAVGLTGCTPEQAQPDGNPDVVAVAWSVATTGTAPAPASCTWTHGDGPDRPDPVCTPGGITEALGATDVAPVCLAMAQPRAMVPSDAAREILAAYGVSDEDTHDFDLDFLIPPALGGANDVSNIWPVPRADRVSDLKQQTDDALRAAVCAQRVGIPAAQFAVASDWTTAVELLHLEPAS